MRTVRLSQLHILHQEEPSPVSSRFHSLMSGMVHVLRLYMTNHKGASTEARNLWDGHDEVSPLSGRIAELNFDIAEIERRK